MGLLISLILSAAECMNVSDGYPLVTINGTSNSRVTSYSTPDSASFSNQIST